MPAWEKIIQSLLVWIKIFIELFGNEKTNEPCATQQQQRNKATKKFNKKINKQQRENEKNKQIIFMSIMSFIAANRQVSVDTYRSLSNAIAHAFFIELD